MFTAHVLQYYRACPAAEGGRVRVSVHDRHDGGMTGVSETDVRSRLLARRALLQSDVDAASAALVDIRAMRADRTDDDEHDPDGAPLSAEWSRLDGLHRASIRRLAEIDSAIVHLDAGTYGVCSRCGGEISAGRLAAVPAASRCVHCADRR